MSIFKRRKVKPIVSIEDNKSIIKLSKWIKDNVNKNKPYVFHKESISVNVKTISAFICIITTDADKHIYCHLHIVEFIKDVKNPNIVYDGLFYSHNEAKEKLKDIVNTEKLITNKIILKTSIDYLKEQACKNIEFQHIDFGIYWPLNNTDWVFESASSINYSK